MDTKYKINRTHKILLIIFLCGFALRIWPMFSHQHYVGVDSEHHMTIVKHYASYGLKGLAMAFYDSSIESTIHISYRFFPPLFHVIVALAGRVVGFDVAGKVISALFGALIVIPVYLIGKEWYGEKIGLIAALLATTVPDNVFYSATYILPQTLGMLLVPFGIFAFYKAAEKKETRYYFFFAIVITLLMVGYTPYLLLLVITTTMVLIRYRDELVRYITYTSMGLILALPFILKFAGFRTIDYSMVGRFVVPTSPKLILFRLGILSMIGVLYYLTSHKPDLSKTEGHTLLLSVWIVTFLIPSFIHTPYQFNPSRFFTPLSVPLSILGALGLMQIYNKLALSRSLKTIVCIVVLAVLFIPPILVTQFLINTSVTAEEYEARQWLKTRLEPDTLLIGDVTDNTRYFFERQILTRREWDEIMSSTDIYESLKAKNVDYVYLESRKNNPSKRREIIYRSLLEERQKLNKLTIVYENSGAVIYSVGDLQ